jgi:hypothetical protein
MSVFDQYEIESLVAYSGAYTDSIIIKNPVMFDPSVGRLGIEIGTGTDGLNNTFNKVNLPYNERLAYVSGSAAADVSRNYAVSFISNELFYDSMPPSPAKIAQKNGASNPDLNFEYRGQQFNNGLPEINALDLRGQSSRAVNTFFAGDLFGEYKVNTPENSELNVNDFVDQKWLSSPYPFKSLYKNLRRISSLNSNTDTDITYINKTPISGSNLGDDSYSSQEIGSLFVTLGQNPFPGNSWKPINKWSQIFTITASSNVQHLNTAKCNIPVKSWNDLFHVNGISSNGNLNLVAVGDNSTLLVSSNGGYKWKTVASLRTASGSSNTSPGGITYGGGSTQLGQQDIKTCFPVYYNNGITTGFFRWLIAGNFQDSVTSFLLYNSSVVPTKGNWFSAVLPGVGPGFYVSGIAGNNINGTLSQASTPKNVILAVGHKINPFAFLGGNTPYIFKSNTGTTWSDITPASPGDDDIETINGIAFGLGTSSLVKKFLIVGYSQTVFPISYIGKILRSTSNDPTAPDWINIEEPGMEALYGIDVDNGSFGGSPSSKAIAVGANGSIYYTGNYNVIMSPPLSVNWVLCDTANNYTGTFRSVKKVNVELLDNSGFQVQWIICGDYNQVQYTTKTVPTAAGDWISLITNTDIATYGNLDDNFESFRALFTGHPTSYPFKAFETSAMVGTSINGSLDRFGVSTGYGAALTGSVVINAVGLQNKTIDFIKDDINVPVTFSAGITTPNDVVSEINTAYNTAIDNFFIAEVFARQVSNYLIIYSDNLGVAEPKVARTGGNAALGNLGIAIGEVDTGVGSYSGSLILCKVGNAVSLGYSKDTEEVLYKNVSRNSFLRSENNSEFDYSSSLPIATKPNNKEIYSTFFGFGEGLTLNFGDICNGTVFKKVGSKNQLVNFRDFSYYTMYKNRYQVGSVVEPFAYEVAQIRLHDPMLRGWRYGLYSGLPTYNNVIFRKNRYGQFRDIIQGRMNAATLIEAGFNDYTGLPNNRTLTFPVNIEFVSGTTIYTQARDYVTATNPSYNPYDSGIYDIYYRSGQPFFDRGNED